jgi:hypothetical protein
MLNSTSTSAGLTVSLPAKFSLSAQVSTIRFTAHQPGEVPVGSNNRQINASLARSVGRHGLHFTWRELNLDVLPAAQRQRALEFEDMYQLRHFFVGGSVRWQHATGVDTRNSIYVRGLIQGHAGRFSAFANIESGNDLANRTIFTTNTYSTTVVGVGLRLFCDWNLQAEVFRNRLNMDVNPESIFVLQSGGFPIADSLAGLSQWSLYFRLTKQIRWGGGLPSEKLDQFAAGAIPLVGIVEGVVRLHRLDGTAPAPGIPVTLDGHRIEMTGPDGRYLFRDVPEGEHDVALATSELPADFDPGAITRAHLLVQPRRIARTDFEVLPLTSLHGQVLGPESAVEGIVIRMRPGSRYTTTSTAGLFAFHNVREGDYELELDTATLPEHTELRGESRATAVVRLGQPQLPLSFTVTVTSAEKPTRRVLDRR